MLQDFKISMISSSYLLSLKFKSPSSNNPVTGQGFILWYDHTRQRKKGKFGVIWFLGWERHWESHSVKGDKILHLSPSPLLVYIPFSQAVWLVNGLTQPSSWFIHSIFIQACNKRFQNIFSVYISCINWELWLLIKSWSTYFLVQIIFKCVVSTNSWHFYWCHLIQTLAITASWMKAGFVW